MTLGNNEMGYILWFANFVHIELASPRAAQLSIASLSMSHLFEGPIKGHIIDGEVEKKIREKKVEIIIHRIKSPAPGGIRTHGLSLKHCEYIKNVLNEAMISSNPKTLMPAQLN